MKLSTSGPQLDSDQLERLRADIEQRINDAVSELGRRLDDLQARLPETPRKAAEFGSAAAERITSTAGGIVDDIGRRFGNVADTTESAASTAAGQARSATRRAATTVDRSARETAGQARAQASRVAETADTQAAALLDDAARATRPDDGTAVLEDWTKADLYERAQELDIEGRSAMSKSELVDAIRSA